jgi:hypothetical protein
VCLYEGEKGLRLSGLYDHELIKMQFDELVHVLI